MFQHWKGQRRAGTAGAWAGLLVGAGIMFLLDPVSGRRRRARIRDQFVHLRKQAGSRAGSKARDLGNRLRGAAGQTRGRLSRKPLTDQALAERIRARMGRLISDPGSVEVAVEDGRVELLGRLSIEEADRLVLAIGRLRGVREVQSRLDAAAEGIEGPVS